MLGFNFCLFFAFIPSAKREKWICIFSFDIFNRLQIGNHAFYFYFWRHALRVFIELLSQTISIFWYSIMCIGDSRVVEILAGASANVDMQGKDNWSALHFAAQSGNIFFSYFLSFLHMFYNIGYINIMFKLWSNTYQTLQNEYRIKLSVSLLVIFRRWKNCRDPHSTQCRCRSENKSWINTTSLSFY